jgi:hypothetical protein
MATITITNNELPLQAGEVRAFPNHRVRVKRRWADTWSDAPYLECLRFSECAAPSVPSALFRYQAGNVQWFGASSFAALPLMDLDEWFVRVELLGEKDADAASKPGNADPQPVVMARVFVVTRSGVDHGGTDTTAVTGGAAPDDQTITAYGLEHLLDLCPIYGAVIRRSGLSALVDTPVAFNERYQRGVRDTGNRSSTQISTGPGTSSYVLDASDGDPWTAHQMVKFWLGFDARDDITWSLTGQSAALNNLILPRLEQEGMTVKQALDAAIRPEYGFGWRLKHKDQHADGET